MISIFNRSTYAGLSLKWLILPIVVVTICIIAIKYLYRGESANPMVSTETYLIRQLATADSLAAAGDRDRSQALYQYISDYSPKIADNDTLSAKAAMTASLVLAQIYVNQYSDYGDELKALLQAEKIGKKYGLSLTGVNFLLGELYYTIAEQNNADSYYDKGTEYFIDVLKSALPNDSVIYHDAATNLILFQTKGNVAQLSKASIKDYFSNKKDYITNKYSFNLILDSVINSSSSASYLQTIENINKLQNLRGPATTNRILPGLYFISGQIFLKYGNTEDALKFFQLSEEHIDPQYGEDMQLQVYDALSEAYRKHGDSGKMGEYAVKANDLRRRLTSFSQISSLKQVEIKSQIEGIENNLAIEKEKSRNLKRWSISGLIIAVLFFIIIMMLLIFIRRIREKNRTLYLRYVELLKLSSRKQISAETDNSLTQTPPAYKADEEPDECNPPYTKEDIDRIENVINTSDEIYSPEFSLAMLSVMTGIKLRTLSSIISDHYKTSFRHLINSKRIREVCRCLETGKDYYNFTVDAIAESVVIKSRTTFSTAFKRETGMTPSQYIRFARERATVSFF